MAVLLLALSAITPSILLVWYFHHHDEYPEPARLLWGTFGLGVLAIVPVLLVDAALEPLLASITDPLWRGLADAFLVAAIPEEACKMAAVLLFSFRHREFDEPMDGIVYGVVASLGFATLENVMYVGSGGLGVALLRAVMAVPGHAFYGAILGAYLGEARFAVGSRRLGLIARGYTAAVVLHGLYDFPLLVKDVGARALPAGKVNPPAALIPITLVTLAVAAFVARRFVRRARAEQRQRGPKAPPIAFPIPVVPRVEGWPRVRAYLVLGTGGILACLGGTFLLAMVIGFATSRDTLRESAGILTIVLSLGALVAAGGAAAFRSGLRSLRPVTPGSSELPAG